MRSLFPQLNPLRLRLPEDFFRSLPTDPGVYIMKNQEDQVLYVGKAKNLKARLSSYCGMDLPRKVQRMIQQVSRIDFEILPSEKDALLRENALLRLIRPPFNRQKTNPESYFYLRIDSQGMFLKVNIAREAGSGDSASIFGAFKGISSLSSVLMALYRVLSIHLEVPHRERMQSFSSTLQRDRARFPLSLQFQNQNCAEQAEEMISRYLRGISKDCVRVCENLLMSEERPLIHWFLKRDRDLLSEFFDGQARRFFRMRQLSAGQKTIGPQELDDLIVEDVFQRRSSASHRKTRSRLRQSRSSRPSAK